jgi:hypothetical protein
MHFGVVLGVTRVLVKIWDDSFDSKILPARNMIGWKPNGSPQRKRNDWTRVLKSSRFDFALFYSLQESNESSSVVGQSGLAADTDKI